MGLFDSFESKGKPADKADTTSGGLFDDYEIRAAKDPATPAIEDPGFLERHPIIKSGVESAKATSETLLELGGMGVESGIDTAEAVGVENVGKALTAPGRGMKGLGVGIERKILGDTTDEALTRAGQAIEPGYELKEGERIGGYVGEFVGNIPLFMVGETLTAPAVFISGIRGVGAAAIAAGSGMAMLNSAEQMAEHGEIDKTELAIATGAGAALGATIEVARGVLSKIWARMASKVEEEIATAAMGGGKAKAGDLVPIEIKRAVSSKEMSPMDAYKESQNVFKEQFRLMRMKDQAKPAKTILTAEETKNLPMVIKQDKTIVAKSKAKTEKESSQRSLELAQAHLQQLEQQRLDGSPDFNPSEYESVRLIVEEKMEEFGIADNEFEFAKGQAEGAPQGTPADLPEATGIASMSKEEFESAFPGADIEAHKKAIIQATRNGVAIPEGVVESYDLEGEIRSLYEEQQAKELEGIEEFNPRKEALSLGGLSSSEYKKFAGELQNLPAAQIVRKETGVSMDTIREAMVEKGLLKSDSTAEDAADLLNGGSRVAEKGSRYEKDPSLKKLRADREEREALVKKSLGEGSRSVEFQSIVRDDSVVVFSKTPSGGFRTTYFTPDGPWGHEEHDSLEDAVREIVSSTTGKTVSKVDSWVGTDKWKSGIKAVARIQKMNDEYWEGGRVAEKGAFYNPAITAIEKSKQEKMGVDQAKALLKSLPEADRSQIEAELEGKKKVTKTELIELAEDAYAPIEETVLSDSPLGREEAEYQLDYILVKNHGWMSDEVSEFIEDLKAGRKDPFDLPEDAREFTGAIVAPEISPSSKYSEYTLPGGENYKEILVQSYMNPRERQLSEYSRLDAKLFSDGLTDREQEQYDALKRLADKGKFKDLVEPTPPEKLPTDKLPEGYHLNHDPRATPDPEWSVLPEDQGHARPFAGFHKTEAEAITAAVERLNHITLFDYYESLDNIKRGMTFKSSHFSQDNILVHIRTNTRQTADGKKVQFIEEIQSDWHQTGRVQGYGISREAKAAISEVRALGISGDIKKISPLEIRNEGGSDDLSNRWVDLIASGHLEQGGVGIPDAPFKKSWPELGFRRALKEAVDNNAEYLAWTTGEQQADRYDLSKQVDRISYKKTEDGEYDISAQEIGTERIITVGVHPAARLPDVVGKEIADKMIAGKGDVSGPKDDFLLLQGDDLKVGGEGMKKFYDKDLRKIASKLGHGSEVVEIKVRISADTRAEETNWEERLSIEEDKDRDGEKIWTVFDSLGETEYSDEFYTYAQAEDFIKKMTEKDFGSNSTQQAIRITPELAEAVKAGQAVSLKESQVAYIGGAKATRDRAIARINQLELPMAEGVVRPRKRLSKLTKELAEKGIVEVTGTPTGTVQEMGEAASLFRDPELEHFVVFPSKDGKFLGARVYSSGAPDEVFIPEKMKAGIDAWLKEIGADSFMVSHNHPTGDPTPSMDADIPLTKNLNRSIKNAKFLGQVVVDDVEFSFIDPNGKATRHKFKEAKDIGRELLSKTEPHTPEEVAELTREHGKARSVNIVFSDSKNRVISIGILKKGADLQKAINVGLDETKATMVFVLIPETYHIDPMKKLNRRVRDIIVTGEDGMAVDSYHLSNRMGEIKDAPEYPSGSYRVAEKKSIYSSVDFEGYVLSRGLKTGEKMIVRNAIVDAELSGGKIPRGRSIEIVGINMKGSQFLVKEIGKDELTTANIENFESLRVVEEAGQAGVMTGMKAEKKLPKSVLENELNILKERLKAQTKGVKFGAREASRETKKKLFEEVKSEKMQIKDSKDAVEKYIKDNLPPASRGKFIRDVKLAKDSMSVLRTMEKVDREVAKIYRKKLIVSIKDLVKKALSSGRVAVEYKRKIASLMDGIELNRHQPRTIDRLRKTQDWLDRAIDERKDIPQDFLRSIMDEIAILYKRPVDDIHEFELEDIHESLRTIVELGKTQQRVREGYYELRKDRIRGEMLDGIVPLESSTILKKIPLEPDLTPGQLMANGIAHSVDFGRYLDRVVLPTDALMDMIDNGQEGMGPISRHVKQRLDHSYWRYLDLKDSIIVPLREFAVRLGLEDKNFERIGVYAIKVQDNGVQRLIHMGVDPKKIEKLELDPQERQWYKEARKAIETLYPKSRDLLARLFNEEMGRKETSYWPYIIDSEAVADAPVVERMMEDMGLKTKTVSQGFKHERMATAKKALKYNALEVFEQHIDRVSYFLELQEDIKMLAEIISSPGFREASGKITHEILTDYVDLMARQGGSEQAYRGKAADLIRFFRRNVGASKLALNPSSALIQPTALLDGMSLIGGRHVSQGIKDISTDPKWREFILENFPEVRNRVGDDSAFRDLSKIGSLSKLQQAGFFPLQLADGYTAMSVQAGAYRKIMEELGLEIDLENPSEEAIQRAAYLMRGTQASPIFKDVGILMSSQNPFVKAFTQFQTFVLTRWKIIRMDLPNLYKQGRISEAVWGYSYLLMAILAETGIRRGTNVVVGMILSSMGFAAYREYESFEEAYLKNALSVVPFVSKFVDWGRYEQVPIPMVSSMGDLAVGSYRAVTAKKKVAKIRGIADAMDGLISLTVGLPGTGFAIRVFKKMLKEKTLYFPYGKEMSQLRDEGKENTKRYKQLKKARSVMKTYQTRYKSAVVNKNVDKMLDIAEGAKEKMDKYK